MGYDFRHKTNLPQYLDHGESVIPDAEFNDEIQKQTMNEQTLYLTEADVAALLTMPDAVAAVETAFRHLATGGAANTPRQRFFLPNGVLHHMAATLPAQGVMGTKTYTTFGGKTRFMVMLYSAETGALLASIEADRLGQMRTGATTGVAAKYMANPGLTHASLFGTGWQARSQAEALLVTCPKLHTVQVYGRDPARRESFCREMTAALNIHFAPMQSAEEAGRGTQAIVCATSSPAPFLKAEWLSPGDFVAAVGANRLTAREIEEEVVARANIVAVDDVAQAKSEAAELLFAHEKRMLAWESVVPLAQIVAGSVSGREKESDITLFKSLGIALEDIAVANVVYRNAVKQGLGTTLPQ